MNVQTLKGFRDFLPKEARKRQFVINTLKKVFEANGFEPLETPALEYEEILLGKYGDEGDKLMYRFKDLGDRNVAMRYDQTVPLARVVAQYQNQLPMPFKRYQIQPVWRAENTQKGRFREFVQCDVDTVGTASLYADAEVIFVAAKSLKELGFKKFKILINDRAIFKDIDTQVIVTIDKLKKIGEEGVLKELVEKKLALDQNDALKLFNQIKDAQPTESLKLLFNILENIGISKDEFEFSPTLARGLNYYTGTIFEIEVEGYTVGSVCGGGRYDGLIGVFANREIPAVGFAFGFDRLMEAMEELQLFPSTLSGSKVLVTMFSKDFIEKSLEVTEFLRRRNIQTEIYLDPLVSLDKQLKYADQKGIPYAIIVGPDETEKNVCTLKNLNSRTQETLSLDELLQKLR